MFPKTLPWKFCDANRESESGGCQCGLIWSVKADAVVCQAHSARNQSDGEGFHEPTMVEHAKYIETACNNYPSVCVALWVVSFVAGLLLSALIVVIL